MAACTGGPRGRGPVARALPCCASWAPRTAAALQRGAGCLAQWRRRGRERPGARLGAAQGGLDALKLLGPFSKVLDGVVRDPFVRNYLDLLCFLLSGVLPPLLPTPTLAYSGRLGNMRCSELLLGAVAASTMGCGAAAPRNNACLTTAVPCGAEGRCKQGEQIMHWLRR